MLKLANKILSIVVIISLTSCATIKENLGIDPPELSSTAMGAATGAAVGATAGAIIGSTSGNAGQGLLLGGGIGAVSGAVIGSELGEREQEYASHQQTINQQNREIRQQNRQLDKLRGSTFDSSGRFVIPERNRSSKAGVYSYRRNPVTQAASVTRVQENTNQLRARLTTPSVAKPELASMRSSIIAPPQTKTVLAKGGAVINNTLPKAEAPKVEVSKAKIAPEMPKKVENNIISKVVETPRNNVAEPKKEEVSKKVSEPSCSEADAEARRARTAATDTDKIFYYRRALRLCKTKPEYHVEMGKVYSSIGRKEEAEFEFSKALEIDPNNRDAQDELTILMLDNAN